MQYIVSAREREAMMNVVRASFRARSVHIHSQLERARLDSGYCVACDRGEGLDGWPSDVLVRLPGPMGERQPIRLGLAGAERLERRMQGSRIGAPLQGLRPSLSLRNPKLK